MILTGKEAIEIFKSLGINQKRIMSVNMHFPLDNIATATIKCVLDVTDEGKLRTILKRYKLEEIEEAPSEEGCESSIVDGNNNVNSIRDFWDD